MERTEPINKRKINHQKAKGAYKDNEVKIMKGEIEEKSR